MCINSEYKAFSTVIGIPTSLGGVCGNYAYENTSVSNIVKRTATRRLESIMCLDLEIKFDCTNLRIMYLRKTIELFPKWFYG